MVNDFCYKNNELFWLQNFIYYFFLIEGIQKTHFVYKSMVFCISLVHTGQ